MGPMPAMFVAAGQAGCLTTASGKDAVVALYALNGTYSTVADGVDQDLPNTEKVLNQIQRSS
jgi:serine-type D-Ala-D-Ala carboxypeptidase/endopeptidase (penicillin-binding protein 4)